MSSLLSGVFGLIVVLVLLFLSMPVGLTLALVGFAGFTYLSSLGAAGSIMGAVIYDNLHGYTLTVIPLFVLMGTVAANSGIGKRLYNTAHKWLGHLPGGLAISTIAGCAGFAAISGSSFATSATMCKLAFPEMERFNYKPALAAGSIATGGTLGILIPPSLSFVLYGLITGESIGKLFLAGIIPGIIHAILYIVVIFAWARIDPSVGPPGPAVKLREKFLSLSGSLETALLFFLVLGGLFFGFFTPTEAGAVGAAGSLLISWSRRMITKGHFVDSVIESVRISAMVIILILGAMIFAKFITLSHLPTELANWIASLALPPVAVVAVMLLSYIVLGCIMDTLAMIILTVPIYLPVITALGYDPIWFGVAIVVMMEIGMITPPMGVNVWIISGMIKHVPMETIFKGVLVFLIADITLVIILLVFPQIALFIPRLM